MDFCVFFHLAWCFQGSSMSWHIPVLFCFWWLNSIPLCEYSTFFNPLIHWQAFICVVFTFWILWILLWMFVYKFGFFFLMLLKLFWVLCLGVVLLDHMIMFNFLRNHQLFSTVLAPFYIPPSSVQRLYFLYIHFNTSSFSLFIPPTYSYPSGYGVAHCGLNLSLPNV